MTIPNCKPAVWPAAIAASRLASRIQVGSAEGCQIGLIGLPDDTGVKLNNGRPGAAEGPGVFRAALAQYGVAEPEGGDYPRIFDAGDVQPVAGGNADALRQTHERVTEAVSAVLAMGLFPVGIGGGHDLTYPFVRAVARRYSGMRGVYFDAHLDVRETPGSGMPFRKLVEECGITGLDLFGFNPLVNTREHTRWFKSHRGRIHPNMNELDACLSAPGAAFGSFDLDVIDAAHAPGVSALNPAGMTTGIAQLAAYACGASPRIACFDIMELSPPNDEQGRTARIAAHLFLSFLHGFAQRLNTDA